MPKDYVPSNDALLQEFTARFVEELGRHPAAVGLAPEELTPVGTALADFRHCLEEQTLAEAAYRNAVQAKRRCRRSLERALRPLCQRITHHPAMTDALRVRLGLTVSQRGRDTS